MRCWVAWISLDRALVLLSMEKKKKKKNLPEDLHKFPPACSRVFSVPVLLRQITPNEIFCAILIKRHDFAPKLFIDFILFIDIYCNLIQNFGRGVHV